MFSKTAPPITVPVVNQTDFIGTMNPLALKKPIFGKKAVSKSFDDLATLTSQLESLKTEYRELQEHLNSMINSEPRTPFCQFKKWELEFDQRLTQRDSELSAFSKYMGAFRREAEPTFVEVDAAKVKRPKFDSITVSLLVSNPERTFFNNEDLEQQNKELHSLIEQQSEALRLVKARLKLFTTYQRAHAAEAAISALKKGETPIALAGAAPTKALELRTKRKMLSAELATLVEMRRGIMAEKWEKRNKIRRKKLKIRMATMIQRVVRGFLVRLQVKQWHKAATKIQSLWRGYWVRYERADSSWGDRRPMKKIIKTRINPDGEEQEYYDYEYEEEVEEPAKPEAEEKNETEEEKHDNEENNETEEKGEKEEKNEKEEKTEKEDNNEPEEEKKETEEGKHEKEEKKEAEENSVTDQTVHESQEISKETPESADPNVDKVNFEKV